MSSPNLLAYLSVIPDPRIDRNKRHDLAEMLFVAVCAVLSGAQGWSDIVEFAHAKEQLLRQLELTGAVVTLDAMGCQREVAAQVQAQNGDYVLAVKANQGALHEALKDFFATAKEAGYRGVEHTYHEETDTGHGRVEVRRCWASGQLQSLPEPGRWAGLRSFALLESERHLNGAVSIEQRLYISSLLPNAQTISRAVRAHWQIENGLHWVLDVTFREDESRIRRGHGAQNFAVLRHVALNLLKREPTPISMRRKRIRAGYSDAFREQVIMAAGN